MVEAATYTSSSLHEQPQSEVLNPISVKTVRVMGNRGPCGGVNMAIETTDMVLRMVDRRAPVYTTNEVVHYPEVMDEFRERGLVLVGSVDDIPDGSFALWSAHGHTPKDDQRAQEKNLTTVDTTCQLVGKVQNAAKRAIARGEEVVYLGSKKKGIMHPETRSILGHAEAEIDKLNQQGVETIGSIHLAQSQEDIDGIELSPGQRAVLLSQTTMSKNETRDTRDELREKFGDQLNTSIDAGICLATDNRQSAVEVYGSRDDIDGIIVVGDVTLSHNTKELARLANSFKPSIALASEQELDGLTFLPDGPETLALISGASVPDSAAPQRILNWFQTRGAQIIYDEPLVNEKTTSFQKPAADLLKLAQTLQERFGDSIPEDVIRLAKGRKLIA